MIKFGESFADHRYQLLEVSAEICAQLQRSTSGQTLEPAAICIKGGDQSSLAVLCTDDSTYAMKQVESSNSVFLMLGDLRSQKTTFQIEGNCPNCYELQPTQPALPADLPAFAREHQLTNLDALLKSLPISRKELLLVLQDQHILVDSEGSLVLCTAAERLSMLHAILTCIQRSCLSPRHLCESELMNLLPAVDTDDQPCGRTREAICHALQELGSLTAPGSWALDSYKVGVACLHLVFAGRQTMNKDKFMADWYLLHPCVDEDACPLSQVCSGLVIDCGETYHYCVAADLPADAKERIDVLFSIKPVFTIAELQPYLHPILRANGTPATSAAVSLDASFLDSKLREWGLVKGKKETYSRP